MISSKQVVQQDLGIRDDASREEARSDLTIQKESQIGGGGF